MELENKGTKTQMFTKVYGMRICMKAVVGMFGVMVSFILVLGKLGKGVVEGFIYGRMALSLVVFG